MLLLTLMGWIVVPATAQAGEVAGDWALSYTGSTNTSLPSEPGRAEQSTYDVCANAQRLIGIGGSLIESVPVDYTHASFALGKAFHVAIEPEDQYLDDSIFDSTHQVADSLFHFDSNVSPSEGTVCAEQAPDLSYRDKVNQVPKRSRGSVKVSCPNGFHVISGGGRASGPFRAGRLVASAPFDSNDPGTKPEDGWRAVADNFDGKRRRVTAYAICAKGGGLSYESKEFTARKRARKHVDVDCPPGEYVLGGGLTHKVAPRRAALVASKFTVPFTGESWFVELDNLSRKRAKGRAFAICHA
jgi:hypothetical protein